MTLLGLRLRFLPRAHVASAEGLAFAGITLAYLTFRIGSFNDLPERVTDTVGYERVAALPLWSGGFWGGERGFTIPLFYKLVPGVHDRGVAQLVVSIVCWLAFAAVAARQAHRPPLRLAMFALVLAFGLTTEVILWDVLMLSESLAFSLLALLLAAWLELVRRPTRTRVGAVLVVSALWAFARDTDAYVVLMTGLLAAATLAVPAHRRAKAALALGLVAVFALATVSADAGGRWRRPLTDVIAFRVLRTPTMRTYFERRGLDPSANWAAPGGFVDARGRSTYAEYLLTHPGYTLAAPFHGRQQALYSTSSNVQSLIDPSVKIYDDNAGHRPLPFPAPLRRLLFPRGVGVVLGWLTAVLVLAGVVAWRRGADRSWLVPLGALLTVFPQFLLVWHLSGEEVDRHAFEASLLLRLAPLLLLVLALDRAVGPGRDEVGLAAG